jgi:hypothetical protein
MTSWIIPCKVLKKQRKFESKFLVDEDCAGTLYAVRGDKYLDDIVEYFVITIRNCLDIVCVNIIIIINLDLGLSVCLSVCLSSEQDLLWTSHVFKK